MASPFVSLMLHPLPRGASYFRPRQDLPKQVKPENPAIFSMTDLRQVAALTIDPNAGIEFALQRMIDGGVRLLLVVDSLQLVVGLITSTDIQGEKPLKFQQARGVKYEDILVRDIMTAHERLEVMRLEDVLKARVGDIVETLKRTGRQHALVVDADLENRNRAIRGIFSSTQIGRQLGQQIVTSGRAASFADLGQALNAG